MHTDTKAKKYVPRRSLSFSIYAYTYTTLSFSIYAYMYTNIKSMCVDALFLHICIHVHKHKKYVPRCSHSPYMHTHKHKIVPRPALPFSMYAYTHTNIKMCAYMLLYIYLQSNTSQTLSISRCWCWWWWSRVVWHWDQSGSELLSPRWRGRNWLHKCPLSSTAHRSVDVIPFMLLTLSLLLSVQANSCLIPPLSAM